MKTLINLAFLFVMMFNSFGQETKLFPTKYHTNPNIDFVVKYDINRSFIATNDEISFYSGVDGYKSNDFHILELKDDTKIDSIINYTNLIELIVVSNGKVKKILNSELNLKFPIDSVSLIMMKFSEETSTEEGYFNIFCRNNKIQTTKLFPTKYHTNPNIDFVVKYDINRSFIATNDEISFYSGVDGYKSNDFHILELKDDTKIDSIINYTNLIELIVVSNGKVKKILNSELNLKFPIDSVSLIMMKFSEETSTEEGYFNILVSKSINPGMSIGDNNVNTFSVYPNPTPTGDITIKLSEPSKFIEIFNMSGQLIRRIENPDMDTYTNLENKGIYFIRTESGVVGRKKIFLLFF